MPLLFTVYVTATLWVAPAAVTATEPLYVPGFRPVGSTEMVRVVAVGPAVPVPGLTLSQPPPAGVVTVAVAVKAALAPRKRPGPRSAGWEPPRQTAR